MRCCVCQEPFPDIIWGGKSEKEKPALLCTKCSKLI